MVRVKVIVNEETAQATQEFLTKRLTAIKSQRSTGELEDLALIIGNLFQNCTVTLANTKVQMVKVSPLLCKRRCPKYFLNWPLCARPSFAVRDTIYRICPIKFISLFLRSCFSSAKSTRCQACEKEFQSTASRHWRRC